MDVTLSYEVLCHCGHLLSEVPEYSSEDRETSTGLQPCHGGIWWGKTKDWKQLMFYSIHTFITVFLKAFIYFYFPFFPRQCLHITQQQQQSLWKIHSASAQRVSCAFSQFHWLQAHKAYCDWFKPMWFYNSALSCWLGHQCIRISWRRPEWLSKHQMREIFTYSTRWSKSLHSQNLPGIQILPKTSLSSNTISSNAFMCTNIPMCQAVRWFSLLVCPFVCWLFIVGLIWRWWKEPQKNRDWNGCCLWNKTLLGCHMLRKP